MRLITYQKANIIGLGAVVADNVIVDLAAVAPDMLTLIEMGEAGLIEAQTAVLQAETIIPLDSVELLAPIPTPRRNVMCLGLNYAEHAAESYTAQGKDVKIPDVPIIFNKATTTVNAPYNDIPYDATVSDKIDWEVELGVIIGQQGKNIQIDEAMAYVFGYTVMNDISARDLQRQHKQFFKGKSLDGSCPMGPWIVTADEIADPHRLDIHCRVNDVIKQSSNTRYMIFNIPQTIVHLAKGMTLLPGDIIATGTPSGVGFARTPPEFLKSGDVIVSEIEGVGLIRNQIATTA